MQSLSYYIRLLRYRLLAARGPIHIHPSTKVSPRAEVRLVKGGSIRIGRHGYILEHAMILSYEGHIVIGDHCSVNAYSILYGQGGLRIGNGVRIAAHTVIVPSAHNFDDLDRPIYQQGATRQGVVIEDDVWIGANCTVLDGVTIGKGSVIGAGSVVTRSIPAYSVAAGVPARVQRSRA